MDGTIESCFLIGAKRIQTAFLKNNSTLDHLLDQTFSNLFYMNALLYPNNKITTGFLAQNN